MIAKLVNTMDILMIGQKVDLGRMTMQVGPEIGISFRRMAIGLQTVQASGEVRPMFSHG